MNKEFINPKAKAGIQNQWFYSICIYVNRSEAREEKNMALIITDSWPLMAKTTGANIYVVFDFCWVYVHVFLNCDQC